MLQVARHVVGAKRERWLRHVDFFERCFRGKRGDIKRFLLIGSLMWRVKGRVGQLVEYKGP